MRQHTLYVGSGVILPPRDRTTSQILTEMAIDYAADALTDVPQELRGERALAIMAKEIPDHARRCNMLAERLSDCRPAEGQIRLARMIKDGYFSTIFLACPDRELTEALKVHHLAPEKDYHLMVAGVDDEETIRVGVEESSRLAIVKCSGDVESKFLPLTPTEIAEAYQSISNIIGRAFSPFSVLTAYEKRDRPFLDHVSRDGRKIFWVNPKVPVSDQRHYDEMKIESPTSVQYHSYEPVVMDILQSRGSARHLICREAGTFNEFMARLHERLNRNRRRTERRRRDLTLQQGGPYRFLNHFDVEDEGFFYGREDDTKNLIAMIAENPLVVLFGRSGIGKTSLLRAGVMARLAHETEEADDKQADTNGKAGEDSHKDEKSGAKGIKWLPVYSRTLDDPIASVKEATLTAVEDIGFEIAQIDATQPLAAFFAAVHQLTGRHILVVLDQFEEYFVRLGDRVKSTFLEDWTPCIGPDAPYMHWAIGIREDFVGELYDLHDRIADIMHHLYRLKKLTRQQARDAIVKPAQNFDVQFESELVENLLDDLSREGIEPAQLQIVCDRLYEAKPARHHTIALHTYDQLGGAERILSEYLDYALSQFTTQDRRIAQAVLIHMVSSSEVRAVSPIERIAEQLGLERDRIERVLARLVDFRLLRGVGEERYKQYELVHEYLAKEIEDWMTETEIAVKDVQDLIARELNNYQKFGLLIHAEELKIINDRRESLNPSPEELELIIRSVATSGEDLQYWLSRVEALGDRQMPLLKALLQDASEDVQLTIVEFFEKTATISYLPEFVVLLNSRNRLLVEKTRSALEGLERDLLKLLEEGADDERILAVRALGAIESHRAIPHLMDAIATASDALREVIAQALVDFDDPAIQETLLKGLSGRETISWPAAYALAVVASRDEVVLDRLRKQVQRMRVGAKAQYAVGLANLYSHDLETARQQLDMASSLAAGDTEGQRFIGDARELLNSQTTKLAKEVEVWPCFQGNAAHTGVSNDILLPPLRKVWSFRTDGLILSSPVVSSDVAYIASRDGCVYAIDATRGNRQWKVQTGDQIEASPTVHDGIVYIGSHDGHVYALDVTTGKIIWKTGLRQSTRSSVVVADGRLFVGDFAGRLSCLDARTGRSIWRAETRGEITSSPALFDGTVTVGSWDGEIYAFDAVDGAPRWAFDTDGPVACTPTIKNGIVCCGSDDANVYGIDLETGLARWQRPVGGYTRSSAAATDALFIMGCHDGWVYALDHDTGEIAWRAETAEEVLGSAVISGEIVYIGSIDGALYAIELTTGNVIWKHSTLYGIYSSPCVVGDMLYIGMEHYELTAFTYNGDESAQ